MSSAFPDHPAKKLPIERVASPDCPEALALVRDRKPFACRVDQWGARGWSIEYLQRVIGDVPRKMIRCSDKAEVVMSMREVLALMADDPGWKASFLPVEEDTAPIVLTSNSPFARLLDDVVIPSFVPKQHTVMVMMRNSCANAKREWFETPCHYEPNAQPAIYVQLLGRKQLWLFAPEQSPYLGVDSALGDPPFLSNGATACWDPARYAELARATCYEITLEPGDFVYWPELWFHWFVHHHELQMNLRLDWNTEHMLLTPTSASWAFANALAAALGGFDKLEARYAALPAETRELLTKIDQCLLAHPELLAPGAMTDARFRAMLPDQTAYEKPVENADPDYL